ncbi:MAG: metalloregulator ArsR/SmtB family transcription factor [bacterium]|nr:metalloregulator ArsR/SmtB family transcription factor [bacterium]
MKSVNYFKALSDDTRLRLLNLFLHYELNVNEIVTVMGMGQSRISRHLKILADNKLLTFRRDGLWTFYSAAGAGEGHAFIESIKYLFQNDPEFVKDLEAAQRVLDERSKETVRFFDSIAEDWEKLKREIIGSVDLNRLILENIPDSDTIVDLGCGTGDLLTPLGEKAGRVIGVEKAPRMLEEARARFAGHEKNIDLRIGELEHLPLREGEADLAVVNMVLHHLPEPEKAIREVHRVLKKGDRFIIVDILKHDQESMRERYGDRWLGFSEMEMEKWLETNGFKVKKIDFFYLKNNLKGFIITSVKNKNKNGINIKSKKRNKKGE